MAGPIRVRVVTDGDGPSGRAVVALARLALGRVLPSAGVDPGAAVAVEASDDLAGAVVWLDETLHRRHLALLGDTALGQGGGSGPIVETPGGWTVDGSDDVVTGWGDDEELLLSAAVASSISPVTGAGRVLAAAADLRRSVDGSTRDAAARRALVWAGAAADRALAALAADDPTALRHHLSDIETDLAELRATHDALRARYDDDLAAVIDTRR